MDNKTLPRLGALALALPLLGGCIFFESSASRAMRRDPTFQNGYSDGCASANARGANMRTGSEVKDDALYRTSQAYRSGWGNGFAVCNTQMNQHGVDPSAGGGMQPTKPPGSL